jgi:hypothetical protein
VYGRLAAKVMDRFILDNQHGDEGKTGVQGGLLDV